jgi:type II secretory pathway component GspD/PulD (secretin)
MKVRTALWPLIIGLALAASAVQAASVTAVRVNDLADRVEIRVSTDGPAEARVSQSAAGQWIALDIRGEYKCRPVRQAVRSQSVRAVKAGWFQSRPPVTRVAVTTAAKVPYELDRSGEGSIVLTVWKSRAAQMGAKDAPAPRPSAGTAASSVPATAAAPAPAAKPAPVSLAVNPGGPPLATLPAATVPPPAPRLEVKGTPRTEAAAVPPAQPPAPKRDLMAFRPAPAARTEEPVVRVAAEAEVLEPGNPEPRPVRSARAPAGAPPAPARSAAPSISLNMVGSDINDVLKALTMQAGVNVVTATDVKGEVTVSLQNVDFESALNSITRLSGYRWIREGSTYYVGSDKSINSFRSGSDSATEVVTMSRGSAQDVLTVLKAQYPNLVASLPAQQTDGKTIILSGPKEDVEAARNLVAMVDASIAPTESPSEIAYYRIKHAIPSTLVATLERLIPTLRVASGAVPTPLDFARPTGKDDLVYRKPQAQEEGKSGSGGSGGESGAGAAGTGKPGGERKSAVDDSSRMLVLVGTRTDIDRALEILSRVDIPAPQVTIEARLVDLSSGSALKQGFIYDQSLNGFNIGASGTAAAGTTTTRNFSVFLDAKLEAEIKDGKARLLASPKISVMEGDTATIFIGDQITYIESIQATTSGITVTTNKVNAGIELGVTPLINTTDGTISMKIHPEVSTPTLVTDRNTGVTLPQVATRFADTSVRIKDGDTVVIGGLLNENEVGTLTRIPFLSDLPFLGNLFKHRDRKTDQRELVIFITCRISPDVP